MQSEDTNIYIKGTCSDSLCIFDEVCVEIEPRISNDTPLWRRLLESPLHPFQGMLQWVSGGWSR